MVICKKKWGIYMDRLDVINRKKNMHGNMIKWWNVNMVSNDISNETFNMDEVSASGDVSSSNIVDIIDTSDSNGMDLCEKILAENSRANVFEKLSQSYSEIDSSVNDNNITTNSEEDADDLANRANEIYQRLLAEAMEDENIKQKEIEKAFEEQMAQGL